MKFYTGTVVRSCNETLHASPYIFSVNLPIDDKGSHREEEVKLVMPLGGQNSGLYRSPKKNEKVLVGYDDSDYYLLGYLPGVDQEFGNDNTGKDRTSDVISSKGEVFRYQNNTQAFGDNKKVYSEIGFYETQAQWPATPEGKDFPSIDQINIESAGDIHESADNHHRIAAKRFELLADCEGANTEGRRPFGDKDGDDSRLYAGDAHIRAKNRLVLKAGEEIRIEVGRSAIIISDDGITITSQKSQNNVAVPWETVINLTPRDGITMFGQSVNIGAAHNFSLRESAGGAVSSLGGVMRLSARDLLAQSYCKVGYQANMADFIKLYTATAQGMSGKGEVPSYTSLLPCLVGVFSGINWGYYASTSNYSDPAGDYAAYCGVMLEFLSLTYTGLDLSMDEEMKRNGGRDAFNAAALADRQEKMQQMLNYINDAGDPVRAIHNSFMHLTSSADAVLSGYDNERLSVNTIDSAVPLAGTNGSLIAKETARLQKENSAESTLRTILQNEKDRIKDSALWALGMDDDALNKLKEL